MFKKLFAPVLGLPSDAQTLALAAEIGARFHAQIDVGIHIRMAVERARRPCFPVPPPDAVPAVTVSDGRGDEAPLDPAVVETLERYRQRYRLRSDPAGRHLGLPSTSWSPIDGALERGIAVGHSTPISHVWLSIETVSRRCRQ